MQPGRWIVVAALLVAGAAGGAVPQATGRIEGKVTLLDSGKARADASNVVVWIEATRVGDRTPPPAKMTSEHKRFTPRVVAVEAGRAVTFPNEDPIFHNVFSVSGENHFDLGLYRSGRSKDRTFAVPGLVRVYCNIHPQMVGYVRVVDSSFAAVTEPDGSFSFDGVPAGPRVVRAWCEPGGETSQAVVVHPRQTAASALAFDVTAFKPQPHKNKYGKDYPPPPPDEDRY